MMAEKTRLEKRLDEHLERALQMKPFSKDKLMPNLLLEGSTGTGKTSITEKWAKDNGINLFEIHINSWRGVSKEQVGIFFSEEKSMKDLSVPNTVLFFDMYELGNKQTRVAFSDLMERHVLHTPQGEVFLPEVLFAIATVWPSDEEHSLVKEPLTEEEKQKFERYTVDCYKDEYLRYINDHYSIIIECMNEEGDEEEVLECRRKLAIATHILQDPRFQFKADNGFPTYMTFSGLLVLCDGTKRDFLKKWNGRCHAPNLKPVIEEILSDYNDIEE